MELDVKFMIETFFQALSGIPVTLSITAVALIISTPVAFFMAVSKIYNIKIIKQLVSAYVSFIRGTPVVLQILIIYSLLPSLFNSIAKGIGWNINVFDINPIIYAYIVFSINTCAGLSEIFRSALLTVNKGQLEAALSIGMSAVQAYVRIIIPQALVTAIPNICNLTINLIKGTSLAFMMTVKDITAIAKIAASYGYNYIEAYLDILFIYIILCSLIQLLFSMLEKRFGSYKTLAGTTAGTK
ncbi:L-cystine transport system permease protein TcyL [Thermoclostridium stercorarium subsp. stercorarium DSM 8532]|jgi:L-cystine transport system permease protein|uniref:L-cystine transport system permease protein TcyL n=3 Tax=Thermoclostridium stercorarium TaxID=1510 RepID=L7VR18_THES1|nr:amino acid ABC transporter permease [Thermoclostridium stercorarium]AGC68846.1 L-cystine transport system permease protein TcyL [Thermoclostridium stercorarium subsp. stercorarium DSM 8532]AGI39844.1 ABC transporter periplasmic subunit [Thermoclostridium stercorarium subsp. stercorarium DSM 8532]ANW99152.1 amino acid ABC transporter permease [Thermoclostridium stercorarium subsp. thermolacticum DSM 2910]ANX01714.1 amino acid ABC transporter permease [Thermoclostridium stercorarium subsp. lep